MKEYIFSINLSYREWLAFYQGYYRDLLVTSEQGQKLKIPADYFKKFTTPSGLYGRYKLALTPNNDIASLVEL